MVTRTRGGQRDEESGATGTQPDEQPREESDTSQLQQDDESSDEAPEFVETTNAPKKKNPTPLAPGQGDKELEFSTSTGLKQWHNLTSATMTTPYNGEAKGFHAFVESLRNKSMERNWAHTVLNVVTTGLIVTTVNLLMQYGAISEKDIINHCKNIILSLIHI